LVPKKGEQKKRLSQPSACPYMPRRKLPSEDAIWSGTYPYVRFWDWSGDDKTNITKLLEGNSDKFKDREVLD